MKKLNYGIAALAAISLLLIGGSTVASGEKSLAGEDDHSVAGLQTSSHFPHSQRQTLTGRTTDKHTVSAAGLNRAESKLFRHSGTIGQAAIGNCASANYRMWSHHWQGFGARAPGYMCGDTDASSGVDIDDVVYLIVFIFNGGPEPVPYESGDVNGSGAINIDDIVSLIAYVFNSGF